VRGGVGRVADGVGKEGGECSYPEGRKRRCDAKSTPEVGVKKVSSEETLLWRVWLWGDEESESSGSTCTRV